MTRLLIGMIYGAGPILLVVVVYLMAVGEFMAYLGKSDFIGRDW